MQIGEWRGVRAKNPCPMQCPSQGEFYICIGNPTLTGGNFGSEYLSTFSVKKEGLNIKNGSITSHKSQVEVMGRPETMCPRTNILGPLVP